MPIVDATRKHPYGDTPSPKRFGTVSPFDPELFSTVDGAAAELLTRERSGKYSPLEVAQWLEDLAANAVRALGQIPTQRGVDSRRLAADVAIQAGLGRFFAWKFRSGVLYAIHDRTVSRTALTGALEAYRHARAEWANLAGQAHAVYRPDITFGFDQHLRGHWLDRLPAIDADLADMEKRLSLPVVEESPEAREAVRAALAPQRRLPLSCRHTPAASFRPGQPLGIEISAGEVAAVRLRYRHVNQGEQYQAAEMEARGGLYGAAIPAEYTASPYPLQYYFVVRDEAGARLYPGFLADLANQPYFVVRRA
jgi:hypothetical protein